MKASSRRNAFTLVEVLVAVAVFGFIMVMLAEMSTMVSSGWQQGASRVDNFVKSRAMLDLITADLQHAVIRPDLPIFQTGGTESGPLGGFSGGTYSASFFTRVSGIPAAGASVRSVSYVIYGIVSTGDSDKIVLQRADLAIPWTGGAAGIPFQGDLSAAMKNAVAREMAPGVVGFQFLFRRADGTITTTYTGSNATNSVVAVGVAIAVIGTQTLTKISAPNLSAIQTTLAAAVQNASPITSVKALWDAQFTPSFYAGYPKDLGANLKTYERWVVPSASF
jgi:prepilin-type N-terminal cleavage/methylation domain-containing protein